jgi:hypothetical protein
MDQYKLFYDSRISWKHLALAIALAGPAIILSVADRPKRSIKRKRSK